MEQRVSRSGLTAVIDDDCITVVVPLEHKPTFVTYAQEKQEEVAIELLDTLLNKPLMDFLK